MAKKAWTPILNTLEFLLQGSPDELLPVRAGDQPESDRSVYMRLARTWVGREVLKPEERHRIQCVWLDGEYLPPLNVNRERREELRALVLPRERVDNRQNADQLRAAMGGAE